MEAAPRFIVYGLVDPRDGEVRYIGKSVSGLDRPKQHGHPSMLARDRTYKANWIRSLRAAGLNYEIRILEEWPNKDMEDVERFWIAQAKGLGWRLTNSTKGGDGPLGRVLSPETRAKIGAANAKALKGRKLPDETRQKMSAARIGREVSAETRAKLRKAHTGWAHWPVGRPLTEEHKQKIRAAQLGRVFSAETRAKMSLAAKNRRRR